MEEKVAVKRELLHMEREIKREIGSWMKLGTSVCDWQGNIFKVVELSHGKS